jgi:hypothetical protein
MILKDMWIIARKDHKCHECGKTIFKGEKYRYLFGCAYSDDPMHALKLCNSKRCGKYNQKEEDV